MYPTVFSFRFCRCVTLAVLAAGIVAICAPTASVASPAQAIVTEEKPDHPGVSEFLHEDGTIDMVAIRSRGYEGTIDIAGYQMREVLNGAPKFVRGPLAAGSEGDDSWSDQFSIAGTDGPVYALALFQGEVIIAGDFDNAGEIPLPTLVGWSEDGWSNLVGSDGTAFDADGCVNALVRKSGVLYVGGEFTSPGTNIAKWTGTDWEAIPGIDGPVLALTTFEGDVIAGGQFESAGGVPVNNIARWDGVTWEAFGTGVTGAGAEVRALTVQAASPPVLYVGGRFEFAGTVPANNVASWRGTSWSGLGPGASDFGLDGHVNTLELQGGILYAGGRFEFSIDGQLLNNVASWSAPNWLPLNLGLDNEVMVLRRASDGLYAGGIFLNDASDGTDLKSIARWNGGVWDEAAGGAEGTVWAMAESPVALYVGGDFTRVGGAFGEAAANVAQWRESLWDNLEGEGVPGQVNALASYDGSLIAGGDFVTAGGVTALRVASWDGMTWSSLASGIGPTTGDQSSTVLALTTFDGLLIAGGEFQRAGSVSTATNIASWNGSVWDSLGASLTGTGGVYALTADADWLYAGGGFDKEPAVPAQDLHGLARWDGANWSPLGLAGANNGVDGTVHALVFHEDNLVIGGDFLNINPGQEARYLANWDRVAGVLDTYYGSAVFLNRVLALAVSESEDVLYAGGTFTTPAPFVTAWAGEGWSALEDSGLGLDSAVNALQTSGDSLLYAGGVFRVAGADSASRVAKWNGTTWAALGDGVNDTVLALTEHESNLFVGGVFVVAGGKVSQHVAERIPDATSSTPIPPSGSRALSWAGQARPNPFFGPTELQFYLAETTPVRATVFDVAGRRVRELFDAVLPPGEHQRSWDGADESGRAVTPGVYFVRFDLGSETVLRKIVKIAKAE